MAHPNSDEASKLQQHLTLLRSEYVKLQSRLQQLQQESVGGDDKSFARRLLRAVAHLHDKERYSDLSVKLKDGSTRFGHMFVFSARSSLWEKLGEDVREMDWSHLDQPVAETVLLWIYTDELPSSSPPRFVLSVMRAAHELGLSELVSRCQETLVCAVDAESCVEFYAAADEIGADALREHCSKLISAHWDDFTSEDFVSMSAPLLYKMFKSKSEFPLHSAVRLKREDVVFLYLIEHSQEVQVRLNEPDDRGALPLDLALSSGQEALANTLLEHRADVNARDGQGRRLIHIAVERADERASLFLLERGCQVNAALESTLDTPLHLVAARPELDQRVAEKLVRKGANVNSQDKRSMTPLHLAIAHDNKAVFDLLLQAGASAEVKSSEGFPPLWEALRRQEKDEESDFARRLVQEGKAAVSVICGLDGDTLLHHCARQGMSTSGMFLVKSGASVGATNAAGETPLHLACARSDMAEFVGELLRVGADPGAQTISGQVHRCTPVHVAVEQAGGGGIGDGDSGGGGHDVLAALLVAPSAAAALDLKDSEGRTPLSLALEKGMLEVAVELLKGGASLNVMNADGRTLLHSAITDNDVDGATFLLNNGADIDIRTSQGETPLELAIRSNLPSVVECLCRRGADLSGCSGPDPPLWTALEQSEELASILVRHGVDTDGWGEGPDGCQQTLLHRCIDENAQDSACFLVHSGCDVNSPRRPGADGRGGEEANDQATPLHLCCQWGLEDVVTALLEHGADVNIKDAEGKTPLHISIENAHGPLIDLLLNSCRGRLDLTARDKAGLSPFAVAMNSKNNKAAQKILDIEPQAAEQYDSRGRNFLHTSILRNDLESVLFLLSVNVNVNSRTQDANLLSPLLLAVQVGSEMIVRNLLLAGASVTALNTSGQTCLHVAAESNLSTIASVLLSNGADFAAVDQRGNSALHQAVKEGNLEVVRVLLTESRIDAEATGNKGRNPLHVLAVFGKENSSAIFDLFLECMPEYPINKVDAEGNSPLLLAYIKGNGGLCRSLVKAGAILGTLNNEGVSIFNCQVATKQLLYRLLDFLGQEPKWGEGDVCEECGAKFGITTRKHHCRHCGRLLCSKCSDKDMPILKYNVPKPVRVCDVCADVLTVGPGLPS